VVQGTTNGTQTDFDGNFTIEASYRHILVFSYIGNEKHRSGKPWMFSLIALIFR